MSKNNLDYCAEDPYCLREKNRYVKPAKLILDIRYVFYVRVLSKDQLVNIPCL